MTSDRITTITPLTELFNRLKAAEVCAPVHPFAQEAADAITALIVLRQKLSK